MVINQSFIDLYFSLPNDLLGLMAEWLGRPGLRTLVSVCRRFRELYRVNLIKKGSENKIRVPVGIILDSTSRDFIINTSIYVVHVLVRIMGVQNCVITIMSPGNYRFHIFVYSDKWPNKCPTPGEIASVRGVIEHFMPKYQLSTKIGNISFHGYKSELLSDAIITKILVEFLSHC